MISALKVASYAGVAAIALAVGQIPDSAASAQPQPKAPAAAGTVDCQHALDQIREIRREIAGIEKKLDNSQAAMKSATGAAKVDAIEKVVNEMADDRLAIRQKQTVEEALIVGHLMEHARSAKNFEDFQNGIRHCVLAAHVERVAGGIEEEQGMTPKK